MSIKYGTVEVNGKTYDYIVDWLPKTGEYVCTVQNCPNAHMIRNEEITEADICAKISAVTWKAEPLSQFLLCTYKLKLRERCIIASLPFLLPMRPQHDRNVTVKPEGV